MGPGVKDDGAAVSVTAGAPARDDSLDLAEDGANVDAYHQYKGYTRHDRADMTRMGKIQELKVRLSKLVAKLKTDQAPRETIGLFLLSPLPSFYKARGRCS